MWGKMIAYILTHVGALLVQAGTHLWISLAALSAAVLIGIPCGYLAADLPGIEKWISAPFQVLRVIPSLAILVLLIPIAGTGSAAGGGQAVPAGNSSTGTPGTEAATGGSADDPQEAGTIIIGSKDFTENEIVAEIYALALEDAGFTVERRMNFASSVIHTTFV